MSSYELNINFYVMNTIDLWGELKNTRLTDPGAIFSEPEFHDSGDDTTDIEIVIDRLGPFLMSIKEKFDLYAAKEGNTTISRQHCLGSFNIDFTEIDANRMFCTTALFLSLGVTGAPFARATKAVHESSKFTNDDIDFNSFLQLYGEYSGLCRKARVDKGRKPIWVLSEKGWEPIDPAIEDMVRRALNECQPDDVLKDSGDNVLWADMQMLPSVINRTGSYMATPLSVSSAIAKLESFLPGLSTGQFCLEEILAIHRIHSTNGHTISLDDVAVSDTTDSKPSSWRYQGEGRTLGTIPSETADTLQSNDTVLSLPTRASASKIPEMSEREIWRSFEKFDITGDHKLTFLNIKSALELYNSNAPTRIDDSQIREWIRDNDPQNKGYVDFDSYRSIFSTVSGYSTPGSRDRAQPRSAESSKKEDILRK